MKRIFAIAAFLILAFGAPSAYAKSQHSAAYYQVTQYCGVRACGHIDSRTMRHSSETRQTNYVPVKRIAHRVTDSMREAIDATIRAWNQAGMSDAGIAGVLANIKHESNFNPRLRHPDQPHWSGEAHYAHGLYQEGGAEWNHYARWLAREHPGADWRNPLFQSQFAAWNIKNNYPQVWDSMMNGTKEHAAQAFVRGYLRPATNFLQTRVRQYGRGVPTKEHYASL